MARYRIHRIREPLREQFRWAAHTGGTANVKAKDYEVEGEQDAPTPYVLWSNKKTQGLPLFPGDVLEILADDGAVRDVQIYKYIGFEPAKWWIPEPKPDQPGQLDGTFPPPTPSPDLHSS